VFAPDRGPGQAGLTLVKLVSDLRGGYRFKSSTARPIKICNYALTSGAPGQELGEPGQLSPLYFPSKCPMPSTTGKTMR